MTDNFYISRPESQYIYLTYTFWYVSLTIIPNWSSFYQSHKQFLFAKEISKLPKFKCYCKQCFLQTDIFYTNVSSSEYVVTTHFIKYRYLYYSDGQLIYVVVIFFKLNYIVLYVTSYKIKYNPKSCYKYMCDMCMSSGHMYIYVFNRFNVYVLFPNLKTIVNDCNHFIWKLIYPINSVICKSCNIDKSSMILKVMLCVYNLYKLTNIYNIVVRFNYIISTLHLLIYVLKKYFDK